MTDLLFLTDVSQVKSVTRGSSRWVERAQLVTGDMTVAAELERSGIPYINEWDFVQDEDVAFNWNTAHNLAARWSEHLPRIEYRGGDLANDANQELVIPFEVCLNARTVYERLLGSMPVSRIHGFFAAPVAICRNGPSPLFRATTSLAQSVLRWSAEEIGVPVYGLRSFRPLSLENRSWIPHQPKSTFHKTIRSSGTQDRMVLLVDNGLHPKEIDELEIDLASRAGWLIARISELKADTLVGWSWDLTSLVQKLQAAWRAFEALQSTYSGAHPEIFRNRFLKFQFERIWAEMLAAAEFSESFDVLLDIIRPSLVVLGLDVFSVERALIRTARQKGIPTASLIHTGLAPSTAFRELVGETDHLMVWGEKDVRQLTRYKVDKNRLHLVGSLRYYEKYKSSTHSAANSEREKIKARQALRVPPENPIVLLLTSTINIGMAWPIANPTEHRKTWNEIVALAAEQPNLTFAIKPHPSYDYFEFYRYLRKYGPKNLILLEHADLDSALAASNIAVLVNYCTTAGLESILSKIPVIFLRTAIYAAKRDDPLQEHGSIPAHSVLELESVIKRLLNNDEFRKEALADAEIALASIMGDPHQPAIDRIISEFDRIALPPPAQRLSETTKFEEQVFNKFSEATQWLWDAEDHAKFVPAWQNLVGFLNGNAPISTSLIERVMFGVSFIIGFTARNPAELHRLVTECFKSLQNNLGVPSQDGKTMLENSYMVAISRHSHLPDWNQAGTFSWHALLELPRRSIGSRQFQRWFLKGLVARNRFILPLVNLARRTNMLIAKASPSRYLEIQVEEPSVGDHSMHLRTPGSNAA